MRLETRLHLPSYTVYDHVFRSVDKSLVMPHKLFEYRALRQFVLVFGWVGQ